MPTLLHSILAALEVSVAVLVWRSGRGHLFGWLTYCYFAGTSDAIPHMLWDAVWWRAVWAPLHGVLLALLAYATWDTLRFVLPQTNHRERTAVATLAGLPAALAVSLLAQTWNPDDIFQVFCRTREFAALGMALAFSIAWYAWRVYRPVDCTHLVRRHLGLLAGWLWIYWLASAGAKGGSVWLVFQWENGADVWRVLNLGCLCLQIGLMAGWVVSLRGWHSTDSTSRQIHPQYPATPETP